MKGAAVQEGSLSPVAQLKNFLLNELESSGERLKEIFFECLLSRARKSIEHLKRSLEFFWTDLLKDFF